MNMAVVPPIAREGWVIIALFIVATGVLWAVAEPLGWLGLVLTGWCVYFFRDPDRVTPIEPGLIVSPADGVVMALESAPPPPELEMDPAPRQRISIFMNVFDVHVNRCPVDGKATALAYRRGRFINASLDKASDLNERQAIRITMADGKEIAVVQIAGLIARRIVCRVALDKEVRGGERFGMIRFGSRVDVYLADGMVPLVVAGQRSIGGETVIARSLMAGENAVPRKGEIR